MAPFFASSQSLGTCLAASNAPNTRLVVGWHHKRADLGHAPERPQFHRVVVNQATACNSEIPSSDAASRMFKPLGCQFTLCSTKSESESGHSG